MWSMIIFSLLMVEKCLSISSPISPFTNYTYSIELKKDIADLWWTIDDNEKEITFEYHVKTIGWIALGISPAGGMKGADIGVGWIDNEGKLHFQDRYAFGSFRPIIDNTTNDWFGIQGRELNGWTAIQFKRLLDPCDSLDYPIKTGTNILIYAYGLSDPVNSEISYHEDRRGTRMIPLRSYGQPPNEDVFNGLEYFDLRLNDYIVPSTDTTYHCKVYKAPTNYLTKRHAIAYKVLIEDKNADLVHHLLLHECHPSFIFDDNNLPDGICDEIYEKIEACSSKIATAWAVGGDHIVEYPEEAGYPVGNHSPNKYFMVQMHYDNPKLTLNRRDSSGIRFYLSQNLRQHDLGYITFGAISNLLGLAIPPKVDQFIVDSYCPSSATKNLPKSGLTILSSFPHTHLQGYSMWTKLIRNKTAINYLFNAESYDFNYQFENRLPKRIQIYPGDEFATRCIYNTMNKDKVTLGGEKTTEEMCLHFFTYFPRMEDLSVCYTMNTVESLQNKIDPSSQFDYFVAKQWLLDLNWTPESSKQWQDYYNTAPRVAFIASNGTFDMENLESLPIYKDIQPVPCQTTIVTTQTPIIATQTSIIATQTSIITTQKPIIITPNNANFNYQNPFFLLLFSFILSFVSKI